MAKKRSKAKPNTWAPIRIEQRPPLRTRGMVMISLDANDGRWFTILLSRVPCIGEEVFCEGETFLVTRVQHDSPDDDGRAMVGYHAYVTGAWVPDDDESEAKPRRGRKRKTP